jgi:hypothetical protein
MPVCLCLIDRALEQVRVGVQMDLLGSAPSPRRAAASCVVNDRWLVIHGGFEGSCCLDDTHVLDTKGGVWSKVASPSQVAPSPRALHSMCTIGGGVLLYGGASNNAAQSSAHLLHNAAATDGARLQVDLQESRRRVTAEQCKLERTQAALHLAQRDSARAEKQLKVQASFARAHGTWHSVLAG